MPLISIILPFRNRSHLLKETLDSISAQVLEDDISIELILVNNDSDTATIETVTEWINRVCTKQLNTIFVTEHIPGASHARNRGINVSSGEWLYFFDSDDIMLPGHLQFICNAINKFPESDIVYWDVLSKDLGGKITVKKPTPTSLEHNVIIHGIWSTQRYAVKKSFLLKAGTWSPDLISRNDWELSIRMLLCKPIAKYIPSNKGTVLIRAFSDSLTGSSVFHNHESKEMAILKVLQSNRYAEHIATIIYTEVYGIVLSADYANNGDKAMARNFYRQIVARSLTPKYVLDICYLWQRILRHGASYPAFIYLKFRKD